MSKLIRIILLPLLITSVLSLLSVPSCNDEKSAPEGAETSQQELQQILLDSILILKDVDSYKMKMNMDATMNVSGGPEEGTMDMIMTMEGVVDPVNMEMQMTMSMSMDMDTDDIEGLLQDMSMEMYMLADTIYMKMDIPEMGKQWVKMPISEEMMGMYNLNMVDQQLALLESPGETTLLREESFDGSECYVIHLVPNMQKLMDWLDQQQMTEMGLAWEDLKILSDVFKELSYTCWIAKDTKYMKKMTASMLLEMSAEDFVETGGDFEAMTMDVDIDMIIYDHNEPFSIVLPDEAENAMEMPQFGGMMQE
jgi:hypothetical protein